MQGRILGMVAQSLHEHALRLLRVALPSIIHPQRTLIHGNATCIHMQQTQVAIARIHDINMERRQTHN
eukprot:6318916-Pyramimonas_sp.AAC.1